MRYSTTTKKRAAAIVGMFIGVGLMYKGYETHQQLIKFPMPEAVSIAYAKKSELSDLKEKQQVLTKILDSYPGLDTTASSAKDGSVVVLPDDTTFRNSLDSIDARINSVREEYNSLVSQGGVVGYENDRTSMGLNTITYALGGLFFLVISAAVSSSTTQSGRNLLNGLLSKTS